MEYGKIEKSSRYRLRETAGSAKRTDDDGKEYHLELAIVLPTGCPCVTCEETKKRFIISWDDVLRLGEEAALFQPWGQE